VFSALALAKLATAGPEDVHIVVKVPTLPLAVPLNVALDGKVMV